MRKTHIHLLTIIVLLISCNHTKNVLKSEQNLDSIKTNSEIKKQDGREYVSDTVKRIIDELHLCEYSEFLNTLDYYSCYDKDMCDIRNIKKGESNYNNFIFYALCLQK